jgi:SAM-dependent methyltransferase
MAVRDFGHGPNLHFIAADANHLPFKDEVFEALLSIRVFHHMPDPARFMNEAARVLVKGAHAIIQYGNKRNPLRMVRRGLSSFRHDHQSIPGGTLWGTHPAYFRKLARNAGLEPHRVRGTGFLHQFVRAAPILSLPGQILEPVLDTIFGPMRLAPEAIEDLEKTTGSRPAQRPMHLQEILACPACRGALASESEALRCTACNRTFPRRGKILDLRLI